MDTKQINELLTFAQKLAYRSGKILLENRKLVKIQIKKGKLYDFATSSDIKVNQFLTESIKDKYPSHNILSEESPEKSVKADFRWVIDPLDGTWPYTKGLPFYGVLIALEYHGKTILQAANLPQTEELFFSALNQGTYLNNQKITCNKDNILNKSSIILSHLTSFATSDVFEKLIDIFKYLFNNTSQLFLSGSNSLDLFRIAQGAFAGLVWLGRSDKTGWWDIAPGLFAISEAGGKVTTMNDSQVTQRNFKEGFIATNGYIHKQLLKIINAS